MATHNVVLLVAIAIGCTESLIVQQARDVVELDAETEAAANELVNNAIADLLSVANTTLARANSTTANATSPSANSSQHTQQQVKKVMNSSRLTMLKGQQEALKELFTHLKSNIAKLNKNDGKNKDVHQQEIDKLKKALEHDKEKLQRANLSKFDRELYTNHTREDEKELAYWARGRELQHGMFHSNLKLTHTLMSKVKDVMQAYEEVLKKGSLNAELKEKLQMAADGIRK